MQWQVLILLLGDSSFMGYLREPPEGCVSVLSSQNGFSGTPTTRLTYDFPIHANSALTCQSALAFHCIEVRPAM